MSMIAELRTFLSQCPFLEIPDDGAAAPRVYVDYLSETPSVYSIDVVPAEPWVRRYIDGGGVKQFLFAFRGLAFYGAADIDASIENIAFYERFSEWLEKTKPATPHWIKVEALSEGYIFGVGEGQDKASYQIQCRVLYTA